MERRPFCFLLAIGGMGILGHPASAQVVGPNTAVATSINVQTLSTGTVLNVQAPAVSPDRRYVGMAINPSFSVLDGIDTIVVRLPAGSAQSVQSVPGPGGALFRPAEVRTAAGAQVTFVDNDKPLLAAKVAAMDLKGKSLKEAVRSLADASRQNIVLGIRGLQQAQVDVDAPRDYSFAAGTVKDALLAIVERGAPGVELVISAEDRVIQVVSQAQADQTFITRTYYLEDLLANLPRIVSPRTNLNDIGARGRAPVPGGDLNRALDLSQPLSADPHSAARGTVVTTSPQRRDSTNILEVLTETVRPEIWKNHGGKAEMYMVGNRVTVKAPASVHAILDGPKVYNPNRMPLYVDYRQ